MSETWLPVTGYEKLYEISDLGRVKSLARTCRCGNTTSLEIPEKIKIQHTTRGYSYVYLYKSGVERSHKVHRLVVEAFFKDHLKPGLVTDHRNGDGTDNRLINLELVSQRENVRRGCRTGDHPHIYWNKEKKRWKVQIRIDGVKRAFGGYRTLEEAIVRRDAELVAHGIPPISGFRNGLT